MFSQTVCDLLFSENLKEKILKDIHILFNTNHAMKDERIIEAKYCVFFSQMSNIENKY